VIKSGQRHGPEDLYLSIAGRSLRAKLYLASSYIHPLLGRSRSLMVFDGWFMAAKRDRERFHIAAA
jgi:hypothetical protein